MRIFVVMLLLSMLLSFGSFAAADNSASKPCQNCTQNETLVVASQDSLLGAYVSGNVSNMTFSKLPLGNYTSYYHKRMIGDAYVELDGITYVFDKYTDELIINRTHWRDGLPEFLPEVIITEEEAKAIVGADSTDPAILLYIDPECWVFASIKPTPENPCWNVYRSDSYGFVNSTVIDAVTSEVLGYGIPPPSEGVALAGPKNLDDCSGLFQEPFENAIYWFNEMGYSTDTMIYPTKEDVRQYIQNYETAVFFEVAHGNHLGFLNDCNGPYNNTVDDVDVEAWLIDYPKMPFAFLLSCDSMKFTEPIDNRPTFSYAFRKGTMNDTVTIGFCGLGNNPLAVIEEIYWQDIFFNQTSQGKTVEDAFWLANHAVRPVADVVRIVGDQNLKLVPKLSRCSAPAGIEEQPSYNAQASLYYGGNFVRIGQRLAISNRTVTKLAFPVCKLGNPSGDVIFTIRKALAPPNDTILNSKVWGDASALPAGQTWHDVVWKEVAFDSPVNINGEVRLLVEFSGGDVNNRVLCGDRASDVKAGEYLTEYKTSYTDWPAYDGTYKYTYGGCGAPPTVAGTVAGEIRDVNANLIGDEVSTDIVVSLYEYGDGLCGYDIGCSDYSITVNATGDYWLLVTEGWYHKMDTSDMACLPPLHIDLTTPGKLAIGYKFDFEGNYGLVPKACTMGYALQSCNHWLFVPVDGSLVPHPEWQLSSWKAMESCHSWQFPS